MDSHLGYDRYERSSEPNYRNGTKPKTVRSKYGEFEVDVPQDRQSSLEPQVLPKRQKDISLIDDKIISMYAKGMTVRQISETIEDIYGFEVSEGMVSDITDKLLPKIEEWQNRPLSAVWKMVESPLYYRYADTVQGKSSSGVGNNFVRALATEIENKEEYEFLKGNKELEAIFSQYLK